MDTTRTIFIALGIALLVILLVPMLFMAGMMGTMAGGMGGMMNGGGAWIMGGLVLLILVVGITLIAIGVGRRQLNENSDRSATKMASTRRGIEETPSWIAQRYYRQQRTRCVARHRGGVATAMIAAAPTVHARGSDEPSEMVMAPDETDSAEFPPLIRNPVDDPDIGAPGITGMTRVRGPGGHEVLLGGDRSTTIHPDSVLPLWYPHHQSQKANR